MKYRSRTEIVSEILEAANGGATKTKIMYKAFLSYAQLKEYLSILVENGLLEHVPESATLKTTDKGIKFRQLHNELDVIAPKQVNDQSILKARVK
jgi:predicted transcriptional regulator